MREILFRGKCNEVGKYNGQWIEGFYGEDDGKPIIARSTDHGLIGYFCEPDSIGQYTGLTDKNGTRVFEGDILKIIHKYQSPFDDDTKEYTDITTDVVHFDDEGLCFFYGKSPFLCVVDNVTAEYEVIGNIYDNPELPEVKE